MRNIQKFRSAANENSIRDGLFQELMDGSPRLLLALSLSRMSKPLSATKETHFSEGLQQSQKKAAKIEYAELKNRNQELEREVARLQAEMIDMIPVIEETSG